MNLIMVLSIMDNGHMMDLGMENVYNYGLMEAFIQHCVVFIIFIIISRVSDSIGFNSIIFN